MYKYTGIPDKQNSDFFELMAWHWAQHMLLDIEAEQVGLYSLV